MNNRNLPFVPTGPRNYQTNGGNQNNRGNNYQNGNGHWNKNKQNGSGNNNWSNRNGYGQSNTSWNNRNLWNAPRVDNNNNNNAGQGNYQGRNFNPNYKGKNFDPNYRANTPRPEIAGPVRENVGQARYGNRQNHRPNGNHYSPYQQRRGGRHNNNGFYSPRQDLDIDMVDVPSDEPNDIEMPDAPPLVPDQKSRALRMGAIAVKEIADTMVKLMEGFDSSLISN